MFSVSPAYLLLSVQNHECCVPIMHEMRDSPNNCFVPVFDHCPIAHVVQDSCSTTMFDATTADVLYAERPEWSDVVPISQYENLQPLAPIFYSPECMQHSHCIWPLC